jgi:hypothetical protein
MIQTHWYNKRVELFLLVWRYDSKNILTKYVRRVNEHAQAVSEDDLHSPPLPLLV